MSQHDFVIANDTGANVRADINNALQALASCSLGTSAPSPTYPGQLWGDTTNNLLKRRNSTNTTWLIIGVLDANYAGLIPAGGTTGQALTKHSSADIDVMWATPAVYAPPTFITASTPLTSAAHTHWYLASITSADITVALPAATSLQVGWFFSIRNDRLSTKNVLIDAGAGYNIYGAAWVNQTVTLQPGQQARFVTDANNWYIDTPGVPILDYSSSAPSRGAVNIPSQVLPTAPVEGDVWQVSGALMVRAGSQNRILGPANNTYRKLTFAITSSADLTAAHGLGRVPVRFDPYLVCLTAEAGRAVGDRVKVPPPFTNTNGCTFYGSPTNIGVSYGNAAQVFQIWSAGTRVNLTNANWQLEVYYD
jgi:hypothetical protein